MGKTKTPVAPKKAAVKTARKPATAPVSTVSIKSILSHSSNVHDRLIPTLEEVGAIIDDLKRMGYRIVLTQGVYDMIHEGHARYLERARSLGDILILGVDSDELTKKRKGPSRPVVPQTERLQMLSHLRSVDILSVREVHHDIGDLIRTVKPDVLVTSTSTNDFNQDAQFSVYKKYVGEIVVLPPQAATSTTARVRELTISGADQLAQEIIQRIPQLVKNALDSLQQR
jgi:D-beta-D-heptose 7-phosphate kinase/D-beta-D-heptose 1-phosphate adenosyltransferase